MKAYKGFNKDLTCTPTAGTERCGKCSHLDRTDTFRGKRAVRCMNPEHGQRCGRVISWESEEYAGELPVYRPAWCRKEARA